MACGKVSERVSARQVCQRGIQSKTKCGLVTYFSNYNLQVAFEKSISADTKESFPVWGGVYLQVLGDGMCWTVGHHENGVGPADHRMADLYLPSLPVAHACSHRRHSQSSIVRGVQFPVWGSLGFFKCLKSVS